MFILWQNKSKKRFSMLIESREWSAHNEVFLLVNSALCNEQEFLWLFSSASMTISSAVLNNVMENFFGKQIWKDSGKAFLNMSKAFSNRNFTDDLTWFSFQSVFEPLDKFTTINSLTLINHTSHFFRFSLWLENVFFKLKTTSNLHSWFESVLMLKNISAFFYSEVSCKKVKFIGTLCKFFIPSWTELETVKRKFS